MTSYVDRSTTSGLLIVSNSVTNSVQSESDALRAIVPSEAAIKPTHGEVPLVIAAWGDRPQDLFEHGSAVLVREPIASDFGRSGLTTSHLCCSPTARRQ